MSRPCSAQGFDLKQLADTVIQSFLRQAIRDGFFHADMHPGNLFVDREGTLVAVDFGIIGRLSAREGMFLAEILYGFITRDYMRISQVHFEAGYVPPDQDPASFAQALRAIGEPIMGLSANDISMARLLTQLFEVTAQFNMQTQPQLLLLQKTMVVVEGVARTLNPDLNMWVTAEPVVRGWIERKLGPAGRIETGVNGPGPDGLESPRPVRRRGKGQHDAVRHGEVGRTAARPGDDRSAGPGRGTAQPAAALCRGDRCGGAGGDCHRPVPAVSRFARNGRFLA